MRIYLITLFLIIADFQIKYYYALGLDINKVETRTNQPDWNGTFDEHPEPMNPDLPGFEDLAIISELDGASRLEPNSLELRQSQGCNDNYPGSSQCPAWASAQEDYCNAARYETWMARNCEKSCKLCGVPLTGNSYGNNMCGFESGVVYAQKPLSGTMSRQQCKEKCNSESSCQFWTWNKYEMTCGLRDYKTCNQVFGCYANAPGQWTGRKNRDEEFENRVFVSKHITTNNKATCYRRCQNNDQCRAVTFDGAWSCDLTYGSNLDNEVSVPAGVSSSLKAC